jgi:RNA polymerase sigma-70 factor (ECF subfamily)
MTDESTKSARFFKLYTGVSSRLYSYLIIMVHDKESAEELVQETATLLWAKFDDYQEGTNFGSWAISIARLKAFEFLRKRKKSQMIFDDRFYDIVSDRAAKSSDDLPNHIEALRKCLDKLSESQMSLLSMRFKKNISIKNISQITGKPLGSLYHFFSKLTRGLRDCMDRQLLQRMG